MHQFKGRREGEGERAKQGLKSKTFGTDEAATPRQTSREAARRPSRGRERGRDGHKESRRESCVTPVWRRAREVGGEQAQEEVQSLILSPTMCLHTQAHIKIKIKIRKKITTAI